MKSFAMPHSPALHQAGFTLLELLIVIVCVVILVGLILLFR
ncbi:MAG TPA: prepilin-type N-terminal cleavage/methylation domain-containing protein [Candidatus Saccharimonadales bacterium]